MNYNSAKVLKGR